MIQTKPRSRFAEPPPSIAQDYQPAGVGVPALNFPAPAQAPQKPRKPKSQRTVQISTKVLRTAKDDLAAILAHLNSTSPRPVYEADVLETALARYRASLGI